MSQDLASIRDLAMDERVFLVLARVALHEGQTKHWYVTDEGHIAVRVLTHRHSAPIDAVLKSGDDNGVGEWSIPAIGTEVLIGFDDGDYESDAFVVAVYGNSPPTQLAERKLVLVGDEIHAVAPNGTGVALALKSDVQSQTNYLKKQFDSATGHTHAVVGGSTTTTTESILGSGGSGSAPSPVGTIVLKAE